MPVPTKEKEAQALRSASLGPAPPPAGPPGVARPGLKSLGTQFLTSARGAFPQFAGPPVRQGSAVQEDPAAVAARVRAQAAGPAGPPPLPPALQGQFGGRYYPPEFGEEQAATLAEVADADTLEEAMSPEATARAEQATQALGEYEEWKGSRPGLVTRLGRVQEERRQEADKARMREATLAAEQAERAAQMAADQADFDEAQAKGMEARRQAHEFGVTKAKEGIAAADKDIANYRIGDRRDTGTRIMHGLAAALGALGAGLNKMPNFALQQIERQIDRDIASQREELNSKRTAGKQARNDLAAFDRQFGNEEAAVEATRRLRYREYANQARSAMAGAQSAKAKSALDTIARDSDLRADEAETRLQLGFANEELVAQQAAMRGAAQVQPESTPLEDVEEVLINEKKATTYMADAGGFVNLPPEQRARASKEFGEANWLIEMLEDQRLIIEKSRTKAIPFSVASQKLDTINYLVQTRWAQEAGSGIITEGEQPRVNKAFRPGNQLLTRDAESLASNEVATNLIKSKKRNMEKAYGVEPGVLHRRKDKKGNLRYSATFVEPSQEQQEQRGEAALKRAGRAEE